ncbi:acetyl-CoA carboxylase biotin carboxyl carrier protein subunit [Echinicola strongylocentroti]|uniref:Acetyl-CoA carboxylase biotin carboxyl carrier protein subunit n=1 Tax=Echinicola strongylocentroti TaxID=1795355 RepID=A0A2Z4IHM4_9BACT|nr:acetyl-CoA carboxylase biotin carboxyl carrier protein subunit [Echinicola strongylocentroti]AWW30056.1 acetyl-CoA carboxylase biotin carboxyl carrier protein subunit [Echinicola strongylocentroti]
MYSVTVNEKNFSIEQDGGDFLINGTAMDWEVTPIDNRHFHIIKGRKSYQVELVKMDLSQKELTLKINNKSANIKIKDKFDLLLEKLGMNGKANSKLTSVNAPMPGLILEINVQEGDKVKNGQPVMILEAMKMENIIKSPGDGTVKKIHVSTGDSVEKKQVLIQF